MGKIHKVKRKTGEILVEVLHEPEIINGKVIPVGWIKVVQGLNNEKYRIDPDTFLKGYDPDDDLLEELKKANGGKL
jgi:hypothetical protein